MPVSGYLCLLKQMLFPVRLPFVLTGFVAALKVQVQ